MFGTKRPKQPRQPKQQGRRPKQRGKGKGKMTSMMKNLSTMRKVSEKMYKQHVKNYDNLTLQQIDNLSGEDFEFFLANLCSRMGYQVRTTPTTGDYGADLLLFSGNKVTVVQAKRYKSNVGVSAVQEIVSARPLYHADYAMVISNAEFTKQAQTLAQANYVQLIGRTQLAHLMRRYLT